MSSVHVGHECNELADKKAREYLTSTSNYVDYTTACTTLSTHQHEIATCPHCNGADETTEHPVLHCSAHDQVRRKLWPNLVVVVVIMTSPSGIAYMGGQKCSEEIRKSTRL